MPATEELRVYIRTIADTSGVKETQRAVQQTRQSLSAAGAAAIGGVAGFAANQATDALRGLGDVFASSINAAREHERVIRATAMAYGQAAGQFQEFAQQLSATTGFTSDAILEAALSARTLSQNYGLSIQQTQKLISVSADLARVRGIGIAESFERVQSAIRGEAEASEYLGLTLNDTFLTNQAMNGSLKNTFGTMTDVQKAQVRYNELLKQAGQFSGLAAGKTDDLDTAFRKAEKSSHDLQIQLGEMTKPSVILGLNALAGSADLLQRSLKVGPVGLLPGALGATLASREVERLRNETASVTKISERLLDIHDRLAKTPAPPTPGTAHFLDARVLDDYIKKQAQVDAAQRRLQDINELPTSDNAATLARLAFLDQVDAAVRDLTNAQQQQNDLQRQSIMLSAEEARVKLSLLPAQQQMAALQRDITEQQLRAQVASQPQRAALEDLRYAQDTARLVAQTQTDLAEAQIRARQAALPATEALEDLRYAQDQARLTIQDRNASADERRQAKRDLRDLGRAEPGVARAALDAQRQVSLQGRGVEQANLGQQLKDLGDQAALAAAQLALFKVEEPLRAAQQAGQLVGLAAQLQAIADQRTLAPVLDAQQQTALQQAITAAVVEGQQDVVQKLVDQAKTPIMLSVNITHADGRTETYSELIEANDQARIPPVVQQSGVRRH